MTSVFPHNTAYTLSKWKIHRQAALPAGSGNGIIRRFLVSWPAFKKLCKCNITHVTFSTYIFTLRYPLYGFYLKHIFCHSWRHCQCDCVIAVINVYWLFIVPDMSIFLLLLLHVKRFAEISLRLLLLEKFKKLHFILSVQLTAITCYYCEPQHASLSKLILYKKKRWRKKLTNRNSNTTWNSPHLLKDATKKSC